MEPGELMRKAVARLVSQDRRKRLLVTVVSVLIAAAAIGVAVENLDDAFLATKVNLVTYVPDRVTAGSASTIMVFAVDSVGNPAASREVDVSLRVGNTTTLVWSGRTGEDGSAAPAIEFPSTSGKVGIVVRSGQDEIKTTTVLDDSIRIVITTDKPVYKPGDVLHMRFLSYAGVDPLPQDSQLLAQVLDPNGDKIFKKILTPDEYGICSYDLALSDQLTQGTYTISATVDGKTVTKALTVKDYVLPRFRVDIIGVKDWYSVSSRIVGWLSAEYFFGEIVQGTVDIEASVYLGVWDQYYTESGSLSGGEYLFEIPAVGYAVGLTETGGNGYVMLNASVTDTAGHVEKRSRIIPIAPNGIVLSVLTDSCVIGESSTFYAIARTPKGNPIANATVYMYADSGMIAQSITDQRGIAELAFTYTGEPRVQVRGYSQGQAAFVDLDLASSIGLKVLSNKASYEVGETASFEVIYTGDSMTRNVYWDLVSRGYLIDRGVVSLEDGRASLSMTLGPDAEPFAQLRVYKVEENMGVARDAVTFSVGGSSMLAIEVSADKSSYSPRENVNLSFQIENSGVPTLAALGISVVDEAVYEVESLFQGFEEIVFGLDAEFVIPQYQILTYVYTGANSLPSESEEVVSEMDEGRVMSTWPQSLATAEELRDDAARGYWYALFLCGAVGVAILLGCRARTRSRDSAVAVLAAVLLVAGFGTSLVLTGGYGTTSDQPRPLLPRMPDEGFFDRSQFSDDSLWDFDQAFGGETSAELGGDDYYAPRPVVVRQYFPETWYWNPCLLTNENGQTNISLTAPDSITSWKVDTIASTPDGMIGTGSASIKVFQPFFVEPDIPLSVVRGDEFPLRMMVYNYLSTPQTVTVTLIDDPWFTLTSETSQTLIVPAGYVSSVSFNITADKVGWHTVTVSGESLEASDMVVRAMEIVPDGMKQKTLFNGEVGDGGSVSKTLYLEDDRIEGSENAWVKIQGGVDAVLLEGVDEFIRHVSGCGEQSLSVLSIDILAYATVMELGTSPENMFKYESIVNQGLQHELTYLVEPNNGIGRGIVWFPGNEDVHPWLTSWGLIAFQDAINAGFGLDEDIITDMQDWLMSIQQSDGSWEFPDWGIYEFNNPILRAKDVAATGYIARALLHSGVPGSDPHIQAAVTYVENQISTIEDDAYSLSLSSLLLQAGGGDSLVRAHIEERLEALKKVEGDAFYWDSNVNLISDSYGSWLGGCSPRIIETTGYAAMALYGEGMHETTVQGAIKYLLDHRGEMGGWLSTQDTVVAFHALAVTSSGNTIEEVQIQVLAEDVVVETIDIGEFNKDVTFLVDLRPHLTNITNVTVSCAGAGSVLYSIYLEQYVPWPDTPASSPFLTLTVTYDTTSIAVDDRLAAHMYLLYDGSIPVIKMILVDLRAPMGFAFDLSEFDYLDEQGIISSYDNNDRQVIVYITDVVSGVPIEFDYSLVAELPIKSTLQGIVAWDMYDPENLKSETLPLEFVAS